MIYASLMIILFSVALLPLIDRLSNKSAPWNYGRLVFAYGLLAFSIALFPVLTAEIISGEYLWLVLALAVTVAALASPITYLGTSVVLLLTTVLLPVSFLYEIAKPMGGLGAFTDTVRETSFWYPFAMPLAAGLLALLLTRIIQQRWKKPR